MEPTHERLHRRGSISIRLTREREAEWTKVIAERHSGRAVASPPRREASESAAEVAACERLYRKALEYQQRQREREGGVSATGGAAGADDSHASGGRQGGGRQGGCMSSQAEIEAMGVWRRAVTPATRAQALSCRTDGRGLGLAWLDLG